MRILQLIDSLEVGGAEMMAVNIANALNRNRIVSHLAVSRKEGTLKTKVESGVGYLFLNRKKLIDIKSFLTLYRYIRQHNINIIHAHATSWFLAVVMKIMNPSVKIVWHDHFGFREKLNRRNNFFLKIGSYLFKAVISVNNKLHHWAVSKLNASTYFYLSNFVAPLLNQSVKTIDSLKGEGGKRIVCLANLRHPKDHLNLLNAFKIVHQEYPDWTLHLIGNKSDLNYFVEILLFIQENNLTKNVWIYENQSAVESLLKQATIGVLASKSEGLPLALLEYGIAKLGVVVTDVGDCKTVLDDGKNGCLVPASNPQALAQKMIFLISHSTERYQMGENLYQKIQSNYSEVIVINQLLKIYQQIA